MKRSALLLLLLLGTGLAILVSTLGESSSYVDFETAATEPGRSFHVVGTLNRSLPLVYDAEKDANLLQFALIDQKGLSTTVLYYGAKPQDFERSEQVVVVGAMQMQQGKPVFVADQILTKCPSKYTEDTL
ncbi:MAG: cytochrome c maturation protein CcmE [Cytophagia bacterium]|nr:cytochrome c maturation protein CcmE [Cytophagia bacterium]